jgi:putative oxidoreductase
MLTAVARVHGKNGPWITKGGYEYNAVLIAAAIALAEVGPGPLSLDAAFGIERTGHRWALGALAGGALGALAAYLLAERAPLPAAPAEAVEPVEAASGPTGEQA